MIVARGLVKRFGDFTAVDGIDVEVARGEAFGFLGPNGAGKSSTMRMIGCVSPVTAGTLRVLGHGPGARRRPDPGPARRGAAGGHLDIELTVRENLWSTGGTSACPQRGRPSAADELLEFVQLDRAGRQQGRAAVRRHEAPAHDRPRRSINEPEMLLLDEPTTGLDPQARHVLWDRLFRLKQRA